MIKEANENDINTLANLAILLWDSHSVQDLANEFSGIIASADARFFIKYEKDIPVGFAQCQLRYDYVEGTNTSPVGYLEGIFVKEEYRNKNYARQLLKECEKWSKSKNCTEMASDCEIDNNDSFNFHKSMKFQEANRIICFTKKL